jgi:hypothetical protein
LYVLRQVPCSFLDLQLAAHGIIQTLTLNNRLLSIRFAPNASVLTALNADVSSGLFQLGDNVIALLILNAYPGQRQIGSYAQGAVKTICPFSVARLKQMHPIRGPMFGGTNVGLKMTTTIGSGEPTFQKSCLICITATQMMSHRHLVQLRNDRDHRHARRRRAVDQMPIATKRN